MMNEPVLTKKKKVLFSIFLIVLILLISEGLGSLYYYFVIPGETRDLLEVGLNIKSSEKNHVLRYKAHPYFNYVGNPDYSFPDGTRPHNANGFRMPQWRPKQDGIIRIVAVGGSTTYGMFSKDGKDVWTYYLEQKLKQDLDNKVEIINLGLPGYTSRELLGVTGMLVPYLEPDVVLVHVGANDAFASCFPDEGGPDNCYFRHAWTYRPVSPFYRFIMRSSRLARVMGMSFMLKGRYMPNDMFSATQYPHPADTEVAGYKKKMNGKYFQRDLDNMIAIIKNTGARPILITHPLNPQFEYLESVFYGGVVDAHKMNNGIVVRIADKHNIPLVDLFSKMRDARYFTDAVHETQSGMQVKAELLFPPLIEVIGQLMEKSGKNSGK